MMKDLSPTEYRIAEEYCRGLIDKEIADDVNKPIWTVRTHKKHIYQKIGISSTQELVLWMVCKYVGKKWDAKQIRLRGLSAILSILMLLQVASQFVDPELIRERRRTEKTERVERVPLVRSSAKDIPLLT